MATPSSGTTLQRPDLGLGFHEFMLEAQEMGFIGMQVLTPIEVGRQSANFTIHPIEEALRDADTLRAPGSAYSRDRHHVETISYATEEHGVEEPVDDRERTLYRHYWQVEDVAARRTRMKVLRAFEKRCAALLFNSSNISVVSSSPTNEWDDAGNATPIANVKAAKLEFRDACGMEANALVMNWKVFTNLQVVDEIQDLIKYSGLDDPKPLGITKQALAAALGVERIIVAGASAVKNTADEGQTVSISDIWDPEYALLCRIGTSQDLKETCIGRTMHYSEDGSSLGVTMEVYRDESVRSDIYRGRMETDEKLIYAACGLLIDNVTTI